MIIQVFNTSIISGPERLVLPALAENPDRFMIVNLLEERLGHLKKDDPLEGLSKSLRLPYLAIPVKRRWDRAAIHRLADVVAAEQPELVHAHVVKASIYLALSRWGAAERPPIVSTHHGVNTVPNATYRLYELLYRYCFLHFFDRVLCVSKKDFDIVKRSGISAEKLRVHINGVDCYHVETGRRSEEQRKIRASWFPQRNGTDGLFLLGVAARLSPEKNHQRLFQVLAAVEKSGCSTDWRCLIFGSGALEEFLRKEAHRLGIENRIVWMGYRADLGREMAGLDLLLSFSKAEGLPVNLLEAGWAGTPVMSTLVGGVEELIPDGRYGTGISPDEPVNTSARRMTELLSEPGHGTLRAQAQGLQDRVMTEFSQARWIARLREIYGELGVRL